MSCISPELAERLLAADPIELNAWRAHAAQCGDCGALDVVVRSGRGHPSGGALTSYQAQSFEMGDRARAWTASHVAECDECRDLLLRVPFELPPPAKRALNPWVLATAAGWLLAALLIIRDFSNDAQNQEPKGSPILNAETLILTTTRGEGSAATLRSDTEVVRLIPILGESAPIGATLELRFESADGKTLLQVSALIQELDAWDRPIVTLRRAVLPKDALALLVATPSGRELRFQLPRN